MKKRTNILATRLYLQLLVSGGLAFCRWREARVLTREPTAKARERRMKGRPGAIVRWSTCMWTLTTTHWSHFLKQEGAGGGVEGECRTTWPWKVIIRAGTQTNGLERRIWLRKHRPHGHFQLLGPCRHIAGVQTTPLPPRSAVYGIVRQFYLFHFSPPSITHSFNC